MSATPISIDLATAPDFIALPDISMTVGNALRYQDDVTIFVDGADAGPVSFPLNISCDGYSDYVFGHVNSTQNSWQFRVTMYPNDLASGTTCTFRDLKIPKSSLVENCSVSVRYEAFNFGSGSIVDSGGPVTVATCSAPPPASKDPPVVKISDRTVAAFYDDGITQVSAFMAVNRIKSLGYEYRIASVSKLDTLTGEWFECFTEQNVSVTVSQSGRAEGRATVSGSSCPAPDVPVVVTCRASDATLTTIGNNTTRGGKELFPKKWQSRSWSFEPLRCSIMAFGAEYQTDTGTASFEEDLVMLK
jgi:hypothetical protein